MTNQDNSLLIIIVKLLDKAVTLLQKVISTQNDQGTKLQELEDRLKQLENDKEQSILLDQ